MSDLSPNARPLVVRCGAFGDMVLLTPLIRLLAARYGSPVDLVGSGGWTAPLLRNDAAVGHIQMLTSRKTPYLLAPRQWELVRWLRSRPRGPVYLCDVDADMPRLLARGGIRQEDIVARARSDDGGGMLWPDRWLVLGMQDPAHRYPTHPVDPSRYRLPALVVTAEAREDLARWRGDRGLSGPLVLFQPGNKRTHKRGRVATRQHPKYWPPGHWAAVAAAVREGTPGAQVLLCGSAPEHGVLEDIRSACGEAPWMHNLAGDLPIPRLLALLEVARGMVSVDTGPAHAAAALGCPLVVLFGAAPAATWRPVGPGAITVLGGGRGASARVEDIDAGEVADAWRALPGR
jgi:ADP-heptose:LPS heptosyltransferase